MESVVDPKSKSFNLRQQGNQKQEGLADTKVSAR